MNHPSKEELISFLYDEVSPKEKTALSAHFEKCAECRQQLAGWQQTRNDLTTWKVADAPKRSVTFAPTLRWAMAAGFMLLVGFGLGRFQAPRVDARKLQSDIQSKLQENFQQQLAEARTADRKQIIAMLRDVEEQRISDYTELRKDLETVAVLADRKLETTERALNQLHLVAQSESKQ